jgi:hypothetical protein
LDKLITAIHTLLLDFKRQTRLFVVQSREAKEQTLMAKNRVDQLHLDVQNLQYEDLHLEREIAKYEEFETVHQDIPLMDVEEFLAQVSPEVSETLRNDPHQMMLSRLSHEMGLREKLQEERDVVSKQCKELADRNQAKRLELEKLETALENVISTMEPLEKQIPNFERAELTLEHSTRLYALPEPLFVLYKHAVGYKDMMGGIKVRVVAQGEHEEQNLDKLHAALNNPSNEVEDVKMRQAHSMEDLDKVATSHSVSDLYKMAPMRVEIDLEDAGQGLLTLRFSFLVTLGIIIVSCNSTSSRFNGLALRDMLSNLQPGDDGIRSPNPANSLLLFGYVSC